MKKYTNISRLLEDMRNNILRKGDIVLLNEGKEKVGMSSMALSLLDKVNMDRGICYEG